MIADSFSGDLPDFTVIKALGLVGCGWALLPVASGNTDEEGILTSPRRSSRLLLRRRDRLEPAERSGFLIVVQISRVPFLPAVRPGFGEDADDCNKVLYAMAGTLILIFPYAYRQSLRFGADSAWGFETNYFAANLVLVLPLPSRSRYSSGRRAAGACGCSGRTFSSSRSS